MFQFERCFHCGKTGHIAKSNVCQCKSRVHSVTEDSPDEQDDHVMMYSTYPVDALKSSGIDGTTLDMRLDTAADVSLPPESLYRKHMSHLPLQPASIVLKTYENRTFDLASKLKVIVKYEDQEVNNLALIISRGTDRAVLFGLQWLKHIKLNWQRVCCMQGSVSVVLDKHT